jgi:hypothetical protein
MKILLVVTGLPDENSPARSVFNLNFAKGLQEKGFEVQILYLRAIHYKRNIITEKNIDGIKCLEVGLTVPKMGFLKSTWFLKELFLVLKPLIIKKLKNSFDVIHAIGGSAVPLGYLVSKSLKKPLISQFIGSDINFDLKVNLKKNNFLNGLEYSKVLTFNSRGLKETFNAQYRTEKEQKVLYRGIDTKKFIFTTKNFQNEIRILFLGGFPSGKENLKGGLDLLEFVKKLDKYKLQKKVHFQIAGPNSRNYDCNTISNNMLSVNFCGAISRENVKKKLMNSNFW